MKRVLFWVISFGIAGGFWACKKNSITYLTTGIYLENYDNSEPLMRLAGNTVENDSYVLRINYESDQTAFNAVDNLHKYHPGNKPTSILITAMEPFDSLHPAGTSLNSYFIAGPGIGSSCEDVVTGFPLTDDFNPTHVPDDLWLMVAPGNTGPFRFIVEMHFDDGLVVRDTTSNIYLVP